MRVCVASSFLSTKIYVLHNHVCHIVHLWLHSPSYRFHSNFHLCQPNIILYHWQRHRLSFGSLSCICMSKTAKCETVRWVDCSYLCLCQYLSFVYCIFGSSQCIRLSNSLVHFRRMTDIGKLLCLHNNPFH